MAKHIFWNKFTFWALSFLFIQQLIVASSTIWITDLSEAVVEGKNFSLYLALFISSLFAVYIPGIISAYNLEKAKSKAIHQYTHEFSMTYKCSPTRLADNDFQHEREPWLTNESGKVIDETFSIGYDSIATTLNTILNIAALCYAISEDIVAGYLLSFFILLLVSKASKAKLTDASLSFQNDRKRISQLLLSGWDNIIVGNNYNLSIWWEMFSKRWAAYNQSSAHAVLLTQLSSTLTVAFALIPVSSAFIYLLFIAPTTAKMSALIATLPRQIQIIQHFQLLSTYTMHWHGVYARVKALRLSLFAPNPIKISALNRIQENKIIITLNNSSNCFHSYDNFLKLIASVKTGRYSVQGENGSGKTTLINLLKEEFKDNAFYLPVNSRLAFKNAIDSSYSTGQKVKANLEELKGILIDKTNIHTPNLKNENMILLLDEWDANLDAKNREDISTILDELSRHHIVIEISHKRATETLIERNISRCEAFQVEA